MCIIEGNNRTIATTGTPPCTATTGVFTSVPSDFTGTIAGNRHYSYGVIQEP